jgi:hypothetical protein
MKNTKEITISIPEGYEIDKEKSTFEKIVFKKKEQTLPKTWEELEQVSGYYISIRSDVDEIEDCETEEYHRNIFFSEEQAEAAIALAQLTQLREVYRQGWVPDWKDRNVKYVIGFKKDEITFEYYCYNDMFLSFQTPEIRNEFLENFKDLIMQAKPLLG